MHPEGGRPTPQSRDEPLGKSARRRRALEQLRRQSRHMSEEELAARIATGDDSEEVPEEEVRDIHVALRHFDLPKAEDEGLVSWDPDAGIIHPEEDADLSEVEVRQLFADSWDDAAAALQYERRRALLDALIGAGGEMTVDDLAAEVAAHDTDEEPSADDVDEVATALHHRHLPKLGDVGLIEYDVPGQTVAFTGEPDEL